MDFGFTEEQDDLRQLVRDIMTKRATDDYLRELDEASEFPYELYDEWVKTGLLALPFPTELGGDAAGIMEFVIVVEEIGRRGYDVSLPYCAPIFNALNIVRHGTVEQLEMFIRPFLAGDIRFSISMSEAEAGSDAGAMRTTAVRNGSDYVLNGAKMWASGAGVKDTYINLYAKTDPEAPAGKGLSLFLIPNDTPGLEINKVHTLGRRMFPTTSIFLDNVRVPAENRIGGENEGWTMMMSGLELERVATSAAYLGNALTVVEEALAYAKTREQFGSPIGSFQAIAHMLADMDTSVEAARLLTYQAAWLVEQGIGDRKRISQAKLFGSETFLDVAQKGLQIMGGMGYSMETPMQRHLRAALGTTITAGTSQIQRQTIAGALGLRPDGGRRRG
ncbi:MAG: acyl-CoA dehydrogenase family protein [Cryobacterium sp.]|nr:acyl-CoA dehydrogenase family protein [Cryobacterium sp.]